MPPALLRLHQAALTIDGQSIVAPLSLSANKGDFIGIRKVIMISLSFDHRIINGAMGGLFLKRVKELIQNWDNSVEI